MLTHNYLSILVLISLWQKSTQNLNDENWIWDKKVPILLCNDTSTLIDEDCIIMPKNDRTLQDAHEYCRSKGGFLPKLEEINRMPPSVTDRFQGSVWTALMFTNAHYQWVSRHPAYERSVHWKYGSPKPWISDCPLLDLSTKSFDLRNCKTLQPFVCIVNRVRETMINSDARLQVTSSYANQSDWIQVSEEDFPKLVLRCSSTNLLNHDTSAMNFHWIKDGIWIGHNSNSIHPYSIDDMSTKFLMSQNLTRNFPDAIRQGTYCCQSWMAFSTLHLESNCVLVTLSHLKSIIVTAVMYDHLKSYDSAVTEVIKHIEPLVDLQTNKISISFISTKQINSLNQYEQSRYEFKFHIHTNAIKKNEIQLFYKNFSESLNGNKILITGTNIKFATFCLEESVNLENGNQLTYPFKEAGRFYQTPFKCEVGKNYQKFEKCQWNFTSGARVSKIPDCQRFDSCPRNYISIGNRICLTVLQNVRWNESFPFIYQTGDEETLFESHFLSSTIVNEIENLSLYDYVVNYLHDRNLQKIWLPLKRMYPGSPIVDHGIKRISSPASLFAIEKNQWKRDHPKSHTECVAYDLVMKLFSSEECSKLYNAVAFIDMNKVALESAIVKKNKFGNNMCESDWNRVPISKHKQICTKAFVDVKTQSWFEAKKICNQHNAELVTPGIRFVDWYFKPMMTNNGTFWNSFYNAEGNNVSNYHLDYLNWQPETDFRAKFGVMTKQGWFFADKSFVNRSILCSKNLTMPERFENMKLVLTLQKMPTNSKTRKKSNLKLCISDLPTEFFLTPIQCFQNGATVDVLRSNEEVSLCKHYLKVENNGYYECKAWSKYSLLPIWSGKYKYVSSKIKTFVISGEDNKMSYDSFDYDSTFVQYGKRSRFEPFCMEQIFQIIKARKESLNIGLTHFYNDSESEKFSFSFHLECPRENSGICSTGPELVSTLNILLLNNTSASNRCSIHNEVRGTDGCLTETSTTIDLYDPIRNLTWMETNGSGYFLSKEICLSDDGRPMKRFCEGNFVSGYYWLDPPQKCPKTPLMHTKELLKIYQDPHGYLEGKYGNITELTKNPQSIIAADFYYVTSSLQSFSNDPLAKDKLSFYELVSTMNNLLGVDNETIDLVYTDFNATSSLIETFETLAFLTAADTNMTQHITKERIAVEYLDISDDSSVIGFQSSRSLETHILSSVNDIDKFNLQTAIVLPMNLTSTIAKRQNMSQLLFVSYRTTELFKDPQCPALEYTINSQIVQATYKDAAIENLEECVKIFFRPLHGGNNVKCVFWDFKMNAGKGGWSDHGCQLVDFQNTLVTCECNHLTSFALLIKYTDKSFSYEPIHEHVLSFITIIGCCLSIFGLVLVLLTFVLFSGFRQSLDNKILANLSLAILISLLLFVTGIDQTWNQILCRGIAVCLHYFILASFGWMLVEAIHQYLKFVRVYGVYIPRFIWKASLAAWGVPMIPVLAVLIVDRDLYENPVHSNICWMSNTAFLYSFLPPVSLILVTNLCLFVLIINAAIFSRRKLKSTLKRKQLLISELSMAICVFVLLGFSWLFGLLSFMNSTVVFAYLFCILNTTQGFFIFFFHLYRNRNVRRMWTNFLHGKPRSQRATFVYSNSSYGTDRKSTISRKKASLKSKTSNVSSVFTVGSYIKDDSRF